MPPLPPDLPEFVQALSESPAAREVITVIHALPLPLREAALAKIAAEMRRNQEAPDLIAHIASLRDPALFDATIHALQTPL